MKKAEKETILIINDADLDEGFFRGSSTKRTDVNKICKRVGGRQNITFTQEPKNQKNPERDWIFRIPKKYLSRATFSIRNPRVGTRSPTNKR